MLIAVRCNSRKVESDALKILQARESFFWHHSRQDLMENDLSISSTDGDD